MSDVEKFAESKGGIIFQILPKWQRHRQKIRCKGRSSQTKSTGMHRTAVVYNRSLRSCWKTHNCVGSRVCRREKFRKFNVGGARLKTAVLRYYAHGKKF